MGDEPYRVEYAKSGRSSCKACKEAIAQGDLRFAAISQSGDYNQTFWRHIACITGRVAQNVNEKVGGAEHVAGYDELKPKDQKAFKDALSSAEEEQAEKAAAKQAKEDEKAQRKAQREKAKADKAAKQQAAKEAKEAQREQKAAAAAEKKKAAAEERAAKKRKLADEKELAE